MNADEALQAVNDEMVRHGYPPVHLTVEQTQMAFASLQNYAQATEVPLSVAVQQVARFQIQTYEIEALRRTS